MALTNGVYIPRLVTHAEAAKLREQYELARKVHENPTLLQSPAIEQSINYANQNYYAPPLDLDYGTNTMGKYVTQDQATILQNQYTEGLDNTLLLEYLQ